MGFIHEMGDTSPTVSDAQLKRALDDTLRMILERLAKLERRPDTNDAELRVQCLSMVPFMGDADKMVEAAAKLHAFISGK